MYQVDAFTDRLFGGNPAAIVVLEDLWLPDTLMQSIAAENNLAETAFVLRTPDDDGMLPLRWFTPTLEMDLCGHATLATAHVLLRHGGFPGDEIRFGSRSGELVVRERDGMLVLDFPSRMPTRVTDAGLIEAVCAALGDRPTEVHRSRDLVALFDDESRLRSLRPDMGLVARLDAIGVIATAPGRSGGGEADAGGYDFVSRFFAPAAGVPEDPVTGSAHCSLIPYWSGKLGKRVMRAYQASARGGELFVEHAGDRVLMGGRSVTYLEGVIELPG